MVTPLEDGISAPGTTVHIFYAVKMGARYLKHYERHFRDPDIHCHELQLLVCYPKKWEDEAKRCLEKIN